MLIHSVQERHNPGAGPGIGQLTLLHEAKEKKNLSNVNPWWLLQNELYF